MRLLLILSALLITCVCAHFRFRDEDQRLFVLNEGQPNINREEMAMRKMMHMFKKMQTDQQDFTTRSSRKKQNET